MASRTSQDAVHNAAPEVVHVSGHDAAKPDIAQVERVMSTTDELEKDHMNYDRVDRELAKYANAVAVEISPEENKRLLRLINRRVLPVMIFTYFLQALDKGTMSFASIMGIREDIPVLKDNSKVCILFPYSWDCCNETPSVRQTSAMALLTSVQFAWLTTCIYIAVLIVEYPTNWIIQRVPIAKYLGLNILAWSTTLALHSVCWNFPSLVAVRTLLGIFEAVCQPTFLILSSMWYKREEQAQIVTFW